MNGLEFTFTGHPVPALRPEATVAVLMSGGVDSSVTAALLRSEGWDVLGVTMRIPAQGDTAASAEAIADAARIAAFLGIPHAVCETEACFRARVIAPFRDAYARGETPNPCCQCNRVLKFGAVWDAVEERFGLSHLATGHYVTVERRDGRAWLRRDTENAKDQTYFIYGIRPDRLTRFHAPLAGRTKDDVRRLAHGFGLSVAERPESMELCFTGSGDYRIALGANVSRPGPILDPQGKTLGTHRGIGHYTIGQRRGIGVAAAEPLYVVAISPAANSITVAPRGAALCSRVGAELLTIHLPECLAPDTPLAGMIRSYAAPAACRVVTRDGARITVHFDQPAFAPTPGQHLVLYAAEGTHPDFPAGSLVAGGAILPESTFGGE